ncbi:hypothetical protein CMO91_01740 [Candidatus Woesearchaeota archaeon]|nr:hypothetical protein [Candidatus Woesearchaeota archaeon]|tara:strand:+ start:743 stop:1669 length:927 start_codon:yes stop_codon:yes gene_type:complete
MKRKVIQIANSTQLISLPREWCKHNSIKKGDELDVSPTTKGLLVSKGEHEPPLRTVTVSSDERRLSGLLIGALYKGGFDEIRINFKEPSLVKEAQDFVSSNCVGFEVVEQSRDSIVLRKISDTIFEEFEPVFKRLLIFVKTMSSEMVEAMKTADKSGYSSVAFMDTSVNKLAYFCLRALNKHPDARGEPLGPMYEIIDYLEGIGDAYKELSYRVQKSNKPRPVLIKAAKEVETYLAETISLLQSKKVDRLKALLETSEKTKQAVMKAKTGNNAEMLQASSLMHITLAVRNMASPITLLCYWSSKEELK